MPRKYIRKLGSRPYRNYSLTKIDEAASECLKGKLTIRAASEKYGIPISTICVHMKAKRKNPDEPTTLIRKPGHPTVFTMEEEKVMAAHVIALSTYGFPVTKVDLKAIVKSYLEKIGRKVLVFTCNTPGDDWIELFLKRHNEISHRVAKNISLSRAGVDRDVIETFFRHLAKEVEGVPPSNIYNYDETNFVDDPGNKKVLVRRGTKYPEMVRNATKACTTVMMCGNAEGDVIAPYVIYKAENVYNTWTEGGPPRCRYHRSKSGWIDHFIFADWFEHHFLPETRRVEGRKVLLGDNLSSHFNSDVLDLCAQHDITFVAFPPNATHLLQPLDVAFFRPLKGLWRKVLEDWKKSSYGRRCGTIPKDQFPKLLKAVLEEILPKSGDYMRAGFTKCGLCPLNPDIVIERLCDSVLEKQTSLRESLSDSFVDHLKTIRSDTVSKRPRKRKITITAGKGITAEDLVEKIQPKNTAEKKKKAPEQAKKRKTRKSVQDEQSEATDDQGETSESDVEVQYDDASEESDTGTEYDFFDPPSTSTPVPEKQQTRQPTKQTKLASFGEKNLHVGEYVIVNYCGKRYPGKVIKVDGGEFEVSCMIKSGKWWTWPEKEDKVWFHPRNIDSRIPIPKPVRGGKFTFSVDMKK